MHNSEVPLYLAHCKKKKSSNLKKIKAAINLKAAVKTNWCHGRVNFCHCSLQQDVFAFHKVVAYTLKCIV